MRFLVDEVGVPPASVSDLLPRFPTVLMYRVSLPRRPPAMRFGLRWGCLDEGVMILIGMWRWTLRSALAMTRLAVVRWTRTCGRRGSSFAARALMSRKLERWWSAIRRWAHT